jgi:predicted AAA+ superfamily ATPase
MGEQLMDQQFLWSGIKLPDGLVRDLRRMNPWWEGKKPPLLPSTRRHLVKQIRKRLDLGLAPIVVVRGPRQIGKTIAQNHVLQDLLSEGVSPKNILRIQFDELTELTGFSEPILRLVDWYEDAILGKTLNDAAHEGEKTFIFLDEVQNVNNWAAQLKSLVDSSSTKLVVTGSSALRIELGRDSLAGRISTIESGVLSLTEIADFHGVNIGKPLLSDNGLDALAQKKFWLELAEHGKKTGNSRDTAFKWFSERGGYPLCHGTREIRWSDLADQLNETVIKRVIKHDLRVGEKGRKRDQALLEEIFRLACRYVGQSPAPGLLAREAHRATDANVGAQRVGHYLRFLGDTLLLRLIEPLEIRLKKKRGYVKICLADHGLRASWLQEMIPLTPGELEKEPHNTTMAGHIAESVVGTTLSSISGLGISHFPERSSEPEIDFVITVGTKHIPLEVKYQKRIDPLRDTEGLRTFIEKSVNEAPFGVIITQTDNADIDDPRIVGIPLSTLMLLT